MGRTVRSRNNDKTPYVKPVEKVELSEKNLKWRIFLVVLLVMVAAGAFAYGINEMLSQESGWQEISASTGGEINCSEEFVFLYNLGASGVSATAENKVLTALYTDAAEKAYQLFHTKETFENVNNICYINQHPNEEIVVDEVLYEAFELLKEYNNRTIYLGPVYVHYDDIFTCQEDAQLMDFDPAMNEEVAAEYQEIADFAMNPEAVDVQLLGDNTIRLFVSQEYLDYAEENYVSDYIDFFWMKNAFIVDYFADVMIENGHTLGSISSYDGFVRNLDQSGISYSFNIYDRSGQSVYEAAVMQYSGAKSIVYLRNYPLNSLDDRHYYTLENGEIRTPYLDTADARCKSAVNDLYCYSSDKSCGEILLRMSLIYIADAFDADRLTELVNQEIYTVYCRENVIYYNEEALTLADIYHGQNVQYRAELMK